MTTPRRGGGVVLAVGLVAGLLLACVCAIAGTVILAPGLGTLSTGGLSREDAERMLNAGLPSQELRATAMDHRVACNANGQTVRFVLTQARAGDFRGPPFCARPNGLGRCDALTENAVRFNDLPGDREVRDLLSEMREAGLVARPSGFSGMATRCTLRQAGGCWAFARYLDETAVPTKLAPAGGLRVGEWVRCQVRLGELGPARVTGLLRSDSDRSTTRAEYMREWRTDRALNAFVQSHRRRFVSGDLRPVSRTATFRRFDDDWRLVRF